MSKRADRTGKPTTKLKVVGINVNGKIKNTKIGDLSPVERKYFSDLHKVIDEIFAEAESKNDWDWGALAAAAGLARQTVDRLGDRETKYPRFLTVYRLAYAVGWELVLREKKSASKAALKVG